MLPTIATGNVASATASTTYNVANSIRFNKADSPALKRNSMGTATNRRIWTLSLWLKRSTTAQAMIASFDGAAAYYHFKSTGELEVQDVPGSTPNYRLTTNAKYRDTSAWLNIVVAFDSTQGTDTNRIKLYVNGEQPSLGTATYPTQNFDGEVNSTGSHKYGSYDDSTDYAFNGYFCEIVFIDGTQYAASDFGEFDSDSPRIWKPKDPSGLTFGTNGHYIDFEASGNLGNDVNGGTDFDENNIVAGDQSTDTCTNNFATLNPLGGKRGNNTTFSEGNLKSVDTGSTNGVDPNLHATFGLTAGSWYFEMKAEAITAGRMASIALLVQDGQSPDDYVDARTVNLYYEKNSSGNKIRKFSSDVETGLADNAANDIFGVALDIDNGTVQFYKNGSAYGSQVTGLSSSGKTTFISMLGEGGSGRAATCNLNFGSPAFAISSGNADGNGYGNFDYAPPSGYYSLCTKNLAEYG